MVQVAMMTGMGISEILRSTVGRLHDFKAGVIHVLRSVDGKHINLTKNEFHQNDVPMHEERSAALRQWSSSLHGVDGCLDHHRLKGS